MYKRWLFKMFMAQQVTEAQRDEDEFLTDLDMLRSKWTNRGRPTYVVGIKAVISEFTNPEHTDTAVPETLADNMKGMNKNIVS
jgi:hypothetical protein